MHEMTPSHSTIVEYLDSLLEDTPKDEILSTLHRLYENTHETAQQSVLDDMTKIPFPILNLPITVTKDNTVMKDVTHRIQTVFKNDEDELCIMFFNDSYINLPKYTQKHHSAYEELINRYQQKTS